jgi:hypothetical protein
MLIPLLPALKTQAPPMKNRFAPELFDHGKNRWKYIYCPATGGNAAVITTRVHSLCS